jgi:E3 ubiquitin-protein ligase LRSAM1
MEEQRQEQQEGYWLMQYQRLLDNTPEALKNAEIALDWVLKDLLLQVGAQKYVPHFARRRLTADLCVDYDKEDFMMVSQSFDAKYSVVVLLKRCAFKSSEFFIIQICHLF